MCGKEAGEEAATGRQEMEFGMTRFDRTAPGEGMIVYSRIENGKAYLEFQFFLKQDETEDGCFANIRVYDMSGSLALEIAYPMREEEPAKGMLLHPRLWRGISDPYLYTARVELPGDVLERQFPLRKLEKIAGKGYFLNGEAFSACPVVYSLPAQLAADPSGGFDHVLSRREHMQGALQLLKQMGANVICLKFSEYDDELVQLMDRMGFLVWCGGKGQITESSQLLSPEMSAPTDLYYRKMAQWSREPFLYIVNKSLKQQKNGNYSLLVYSNQKKVALYVEGILFEFQASPPEFLFEEIPGERRPLLLTAEAGECRVSVTAYV